MIGSQFFAVFSLRLNNIEIQVKGIHAVTKRLEQRRIAIFNCDELINIFLISARYSKDSDSWCGNRQISLIRERILIVQEYPVVDL